MRRVILLAAVLLAGCVSQEQQAANNAAVRQQWLDQQRKNCLDYGFTEGTDAFATCMQNGINARRQEVQQAQMAAAAAKPILTPLPASGSGSIYPPPPVQHRQSVNCTSTAIGGTVHTNCN